MCGIVGYIGEKIAKPILIEGLLRLEYRGYDSAGVSIIENGEMITKKTKGRVADLDSLEGINEIVGSVGISHTRWATHGKPCDENSHPHNDSNNLFSVVHNGIIENYSELKSFLEMRGYNFISQTDTEVIPNLIHYYYMQDEMEDEGKFLRAVSNACKDLIGSYAIGVVSKLYPNIMIASRRESPLVIGKGEGENYVASDINAVLSYTKDFYLMGDKEIAQISKEKIDIYNQDLEPIQKELKTITWDAAAIEKNGYEDFMLKEIHEQPFSIRETIGDKLGYEKVMFNDLDITKDYLTSVNKIYIVACGTAMHAGLAVKKTFEKFLRIPVFVDIASEFRYREPLLDEKTLAIYVSQSGETADTIAALKLAKQVGAKTLAISNVIGSSITREAEYSIYTHAGPEIAVASTKAYTSQVLLLTLLAIYFAEVLERETDVDELKELKNDILKLPVQIEEILCNVEPIKAFAKRVYEEKDMFFLGRGIDYAVNLEGSLKLKEISYIHSEAYASGELKHGPIALIENDVTVISVITDSKLVSKSISNVAEVVARGAKTLVITNQELTKEEFDEVIQIPDTNPLISSILSVIPLQLLAYYISKEKGLDVDKPRNLAKSVTVE